MSNINNGEIRKFKMHPDLLFSVIKSQAGTQEKALLEAVMNSIDAGATQCNITLDSDGYKIIDDGRGFASRKEVDEFFETFGTPHKDGDAKYGKFRMGRGQLFAFSSTVWKTNTFEMHVDIKRDGLDYTFKENCNFTNGCIIEGTWYEPLTTQNIYQVSTEFEKLIKYMHIPVTLNGKNLSIKAEEQKWDYQEKDFYVKINRNSSVLSVYNMGALVSHYPSSRFGVAGVVVTKSQLQVNLARNDVLISECSLWKKITRKMNEIMGIEIQKRNVLNSSERSAIIDKILAREIYIGSVYTKGLLEDISGKKISFKTLLKVSSLAFSSGIRNQKKLEEKINDFGHALVLSHDVLGQFYCNTAEEFVSKIQHFINEDNEQLKEKIDAFNAAKRWDAEMRHTYSLLIGAEFNPIIKDIEDLKNGMNDFSQIIPENKLSKNQNLFLQTIDSTLSISIARMVYRRCIYDGSQEDINRGYIEFYNNIRKFVRKIYIGKSDTCDAWTDGSSYIVINENFVNSDPLTVINLLIHEYCHNENSNETHDHGVEFYQDFHEVLSRDSKEIHTISYNYQKFYNRKLLKAGLVPKKYLDENAKIFETHYSLNEQQAELALIEEGILKGDKIDVALSLPEGSSISHTKVKKPVSKKAKKQPEDIIEIVLDFSLDNE